MQQAVGAYAGRPALGSLLRRENVSVPVAERRPGFGLRRASPEHSNLSLAPFE